MAASAVEVMRPWARWTASGTTHTRVRRRSRGSISVRTTPNCAQLDHRRRHVALGGAGPGRDLADGTAGVGGDVEKHETDAVVDALSGQSLLGQLHEPPAQQEQVRGFHIRNIYI